MEDLRIHESGDSPFLNDTVFAQRAAAGRMHTSDQYLAVAQLCIKDGEIEVVRDYFIGSGLVFVGQLDASEKVLRALSD